MRHDRTAKSARSVTASWRPCIAWNLWKTCKTASKICSLFFIILIPYSSHPTILLKQATIVPHQSNLEIAISDFMMLFFKLSLSCIFHCVKVFGGWPILIFYPFNPKTKMYWNFSVTTYIFYFCYFVFHLLKAIETRESVTWYFLFVFKNFYLCGGGPNWIHKSDTIVLISFFVFELKGWWRVTRSMVCILTKWTAPMKPYIQYNGDTLVNYNNNLWS